MKTIIAKFNFWNFLIGIIVGAGVGIYMFSLLVPSGYDMMVLYHLKDGAHYDGKSGTMMIEGTSTRK
jgi:hypothetical protein